MVANQSWIYQGRQYHGWFGHGTSPHDDPDAADAADPLFQPDNAAQRVDYAAYSLVAHVPRGERSRWNGAADAALRGDLQTAVGAWYAASGLDRDAFQARFLAVRPEDRTKPEKDPDARIGGNITDVVSPSTSNLDQIRRAISKKIAEKQAYHIILNLGRANITRQQVIDLLTRRPVQNLKELFVHEKNGAISHILPKPEQITPPGK